MKIIFCKLNQGSFTPMKWSPGGAGARQQPPSNQSAGFNEPDSHQQVKQDFFQHQDNFDRQQQTFEQETQQHQRNVRYDFNYDDTCMFQKSLENRFLKSLERILSSSWFGVMNYES